MNNQMDIDALKQALESGKSMFVLLPTNPSFDATAAGLALFLSLREAGKSVFIGSPTKMRVEYTSLVGINEISDKIGNRNLIIAFDYQEDAIEKVSYNVEEGKFNLVIEPKAGHPPLESKGVKFSYEGIEAQLIFVVGARRLEELGELYERNRQVVNTATIINIDTKAANTKFGQVNFVIQGAAAISELAYDLLKKANLPFNVDIVGNLMKGIETQTQNLQAPFVGPDTFEAVAQLMRAGAKRGLAFRATPPGMRLTRPMPSMPPLMQTPQRTPPPPVPPPSRLEEPTLNVGNVQAAESYQDLPQQRLQGQGEGPTQTNQSRTSQNTTGDQRVQDDWLKPPRIYKSSTKV